MLFQACRKPSKMSSYSAVLSSEDETSGNQSSFDHLPLTRLKSLKERDEVLILYTVVGDIVYAGFCRKIQPQININII